MDYEIVNIKEKNVAGIKLHTSNSDICLYFTELKCNCTLYNIQLVL